MAARHLTPQGSKVMALIGNGAQAEFQALAMKAVVGISELRLYDIDPAATRKAARNLADSGLRIVSCLSAQGAQIVTTCTADNTYATILSDNMVGEGIHINAIGGDCPGKTELHSDILARATTFVEFEPQTRIEGEVQQMPANYPVTEFWRVVLGEAAGRRDTRQITLFDSVGFAIEDFSALRYLHEGARHRLPPPARHPRRSRRSPRPVRNAAAGRAYAVGDLNEARRRLPLAKSSPQPSGAPAAWFLRSRGKPFHRHGRAAARRGPHSWDRSAGCRSTGARIHRNPRGSPARAVRP